MAHFKNDLTGDVIAADGPVATYYETQPHWEPYDPYEGQSGPAPQAGGLFDFVAGLKGQALDNALKAAGIPKTGLVSEQRDKLLLKLSDGATEPVPAPDTAPPAPAAPEEPAQPTDDGVVETSPENTEE